MIYLQDIERPSQLERGDSVVFTLSNGKTYKGTIHYYSRRNSYYISINGECGNDIVFRELGLDQVAFTKEVLGYVPIGNWPETKSLEDLSKQLDALLKVNKLEKVEEPEKPTPPSEWDWLLG